jgi:formylglycine-generating enzyme required for sulfatase activity
MKKLIYIGLLCLTYLTTFGQEAEQIDLGPYGTYWFKNEKSLEYFETQIKLWEKKVLQNKKDANAWLNLFCATKRAWKISIQQKQNNTTNNNLKKFDYKKIAEEAYAIIPNTFEANFMVHFKESTYIKINYDYLLKAHELKPFENSILCELLLYYELIQDAENAKKVAVKISETNILSNLEYVNAYNILIELSQNAILITEDQEEFTACLVLQKTKNIKPNILVSTHFILNPAYSFSYEYTDKTFARLGLKCVRYSEDLKDETKKINNFRVNIDGEELGRKNYELLFNSTYPVFVSNSSIMSFMKDFSDKLYLHGLTYRYNKTPTNYIYDIKENYEKNYSLDFLKHDYLPIQEYKFNQSLYYMYYPSALKLYQFYQEKGMYLQQQEMKKFIQLLAKKSGKDFIKNNDLFKENDVVTYSRAEIDFDKLQKSFVALNEVEHIGKFEVTNREYNLFLKNLKQTKNYELYYKCMIDSTRWSRVFPTAFHNPMVDYYHHHPAYANYPIVNIPYEGAVAYCKWLTVQYNQQHPEGKYISFRLPTEQEWRYAAGSKNEKTITPFPNDNILSCNPKNKSNRSNDTSSHCLYLGNIKTAEGYQADGGFSTTTVTSYPPNSLGIYNTFGNVAEMTNTKGIIKGGSWDDVFEDCTFDKNATYATPDPRVGFRIMMEIVPDILDLPTSKIAPNLGVDKTEITHFYWLEFLEYQKDYYGENSPEYRNNLPDSTLVKKGECEHYTSKLYAHPAYRDMPMIGITQKQAQNYTEWRTNRVFEHFLINNGYLKRIENAPKGDFTVEKYFTNNLIDYTSNKLEKFPFYPSYSIPTINDYNIFEIEIRNNRPPFKSKDIKMQLEIDSISFCNLFDHRFSKLEKDKSNTFYYLRTGVAEWTSEKDMVINGSVEKSDLFKKGEAYNASNFQYIGFRNKVAWKKWEGKGNIGFNYLYFSNRYSEDPLKPLLKVKITDNFYCDEYEIRIQDYKRFISWNKTIFGENSEEFKNSIPDTSHWNANDLNMFHGKSKNVSPYDQKFTLLKGVTENQLRSYNQWISNSIFYNYLYAQGKIREIHFTKTTKDNYFTIERYFNGFFDSLLIGEKVNFYPEQRVPNEFEKIMCQKYSDSIVINGKFNFDEAKSIFSNKHLAENYDFKCIVLEMQPGQCIFQWTPRSKNFIPNKPFNIWENYRMIVEWKPWNPNKTN